MPDFNKVRLYFPRKGIFMNDSWLTERLNYIRGLKAPSEAQSLMLLLAEMPDRSPEEERKLTALIRAEKAAGRAQRAKANVTRILSADKIAARKARNRELYNAAGLLILAGLVDTKTGKPTRHPAEILGGFLELAQGSEVSEFRRQAWKRAGEAILTERRAIGQRPSDTADW